jgi:hypothetical protein
MEYKCIQEIRENKICDPLPIVCLLSVLKTIPFKRKVAPHLTDVVLDSFEDMNKNKIERQNELKMSLKELQQKIDKIEEKYFITEK